MFFQYKVSWENYKPVRKESMRFKRMRVHKHFFQSKMVPDISKRVEDMNKPKEVEQDENLEEEAMTASA
jgi:hypothetical protein